MNSKNNSQEMYNRERKNSYNYHQKYRRNSSNNNYRYDYFNRYNNFNLFQYPNIQASSSYPTYQNQNFSNSYQANRWPPRNWKPIKKKDDRPKSPLTGSEEHTLKKIQETSDMIKKQLMGIPVSEPTKADTARPRKPLNKNGKTKLKKKIVQKRGNITKHRLKKDVLKKRIISEPAKATTYNIKDIHDQIIKHIVKLNSAKKQNFINADSTGFDDAIQRIYKQKSLELSKALREMSKQVKPEASEIVNSIIPDFAIKVEELPKEIIRALSSSFEQIGNIVCIDDQDEAVLTDGHDEFQNWIVKKENLDMLEDDDQLNEVGSEQEILDEVPQNVGSVGDSFQNLIVKTEELQELEYQDHSNEIISEEISNTNVTDVVGDSNGFPNVNLETSQNTINSNESNFLNEIPNEKATENLSKSPSLIQNKTESSTQTDSQMEQLSADSESLQSKYLTVETHLIKSPTDYGEGLEMILEFDYEIGKLTKMRQEILGNLKEVKKESIVAEAPAPQNNDAQQETIKLEADYDVQNENEDASTDKSVNIDLENLPGVVTTCKVVPDKNEILLGTQCGKIMYYNLATSKCLQVVEASRIAITHLDFINANQYLVFAGTDRDPAITVFAYKSGNVKKQLPLEGNLRTMEKGWGYLFLGGTTGYLTRYNPLKDKIEFDYCISQMTIEDVKTTNEGVRRILVILFAQRETQNYIHIRDAFSLLHLRTVVNAPNICNFLLFNDLIYFASMSDISVYNFYHGHFVAKYSVPSCNPVQFLRRLGNLLMAVTVDGFFVYNMESMGDPNFVHCNMVSSVDVAQNKLLYGTWTRHFKVLSISN